MDQLETVSALRRQISAWKSAGQTVGFVPTMGALHEGHRALMRAAREACDKVVVSIFVNPTQFGPGEDYESYPRRMEADRAACEAEGVSILYTPDEEVMYPPGFSTFVQEEMLSMPLCGKGRPGHFRGVCTVVTKLLNQVGPDIAVFGQKDAQQALIVKRVVRDLDLPVQIQIHPIVREEDGLAMSSRNRYLSDQERKHALVLQRGLKAIEAAFLEGKKDAHALTATATAILAAQEGVKLEYIEVLSAETLLPSSRVEDKVVVAIAAKVGPARLIDNTVLDGRRGVVLSHV